MNFVFLILLLSITLGQLVRIPIGTHGGITLLDSSVIFLTILGLIKVKLRLKNPPIFLKVFFGFLSICLVSLFFTPLHLTNAQYISSLFYTVRLAFYTLLFWLIISKVFGNLQDIIVSLLFYSGLGIATLGLLQFLLIPNLDFMSQYGWDPHYFRTVSTFFDPNFAGAYLTLTLILGYQKLRNTNKWHILFLLVIFLALLTTFSRSSYLMFLVSGLSFSLLKKSKRLLILTFTLFIIFLLGFYFYTLFIAQPRNIDRGQSASFRISTWQQGLDIFQHSPILGVGYNSYRYAVSEYNLADNQFIQSHGASSNDSSLLSILATTGIAGFIIYILFLITLLKTSLKNNLILIAAILGLLVHSVFANSLFYPFILIWIFLKAADKETLKASS